MKGNYFMNISSELFLNKTKKGSQDLAEKNNLIYRLIRIDNENYVPYPSESDDRSEIKDRICIEIDNGKVTKATYK